MQQCSVCAHPHRATIEKAADATEGDLGELATRFKVSVRALERHEAKHPRARAKKKPAKTPRPARATVASRAPSPPVDDDDDDAAPETSRTPESKPRQVTSLERVERLIDTLERIADEFTPDTPAGDRVAVAKALVAPLKLLSHLRGEFGASESTVVSSPYFKRLLGVILEALRPHKVARQAVIDALEQAQRGGPSEAAS